MKKTVFVVFKRGEKAGTSEQFHLADVFVCVRTTFEKAATEAREIKPAVILEQATAPDAEPQQVNRWELS